MKRPTPRARAVFGSAALAVALVGIAAGPWAQPPTWAAWAWSVAAVLLAALGAALAWHAPSRQQEPAQPARERELAALNARLEGSVAERTAQLESRNAELRSMARMVAHDVRAPVQSVGKLLEIALDTDAPRRHEMLKAAIDECRHVVDVVEALRLMALSESGPMGQAAVAMEALAAQAELRQRGAQGWRGRVVIEPLPPAHGDPVLLAAVWTNLIGNAMKFSRLADKPELRISGGAEGRRVHYAVADNGVGFPQAQAARLFRAFERLHGDARYPGTGLGLDIVRRIVERHGGGVAADSEPGQGAVFSFWLPRRDA